MKCDGNDLWMKFRKEIIEDSSPLNVRDKTDRDCQRDDTDVLVVKIFLVYFPLKVVFVDTDCFVAWPILSYCHESRHWTVVER